MKEHGSSFQKEFQKICEKAIQNNTDLQHLSFKTRMNLPPIFKSRHAVLYKMANSLPKNNLSSSTQRTTTYPIQEQKMGVCNIIFSKKKAESQKEKSRGFRMYDNDSYKESKYSKFEGMKSTQYQTLRATRPKFAHPSFSQRKQHKQTSIQQLISHFSVGYNTNREDDLILTLQKSKSNLRETVGQNSNGRHLNKLKMECGKLTIYPNQDGILRKKNRSEFKQIGQFEPWNPQDVSENSYAIKRV